jgi:RsiW-degrading membrane proteinase PrsW (M82 family)
MVAMVIIMFLIGVLILLFAGRLAEILMARARLRGRENGPMTAKRRLHEPHGRLAVEKIRA